MDITSTDIDQFQSLKDKIDKEAYNILCKIDEIRPIKGYSSLEVSEIGDDSIEFEGTEYWGYGGQETYYASFPIGLLYEKVALKQHLDKLHEKNKEDKLKEKRIEQGKRQKKKRQYERLKKEFGD